MDSYNDNSGAVAAVLLTLFFVYFLILIAAYVVSSIFYMKLFEKAGVQGKWRAWIPLYREMVFVKLGDLNPWWLLILWGAAIVLSWIPFIGGLIGLAGYVYVVLAAYRVGQKLQKEGAWVVLFIFLSIIWLGIVALDKSRWNTAVPRAPWAGNFLADNTVWQGIPVQAAAGGYAPPAAPGYPAPGAYPPPPAAGYPAPGAPTPPPTAAPNTPPASPTEPPAGPTEPPAGPTEPPAAPEPPRS